MNKKIVDLSIYLPFHYTKLYKINSYFPGNFHGEFIYFFGIHKTNITVKNFQFSICKIPFGNTGNSNSFNINIYIGIAGIKIYNSSKRCLRFGKYSSYLVSY